MRRSDAAIHRGGSLSVRVSCSCSSLLAFVELQSNLRSCLASICPPPSLIIVVSVPISLSLRRIVRALSLRARAETSAVVAPSPLSLGSFLALLLWSFGLLCASSSPTALPACNGTTLSTAKQSLRIVEGLRQVAYIPLTDAQPWLGTGSLPRAPLMQNARCEILCGRASLQKTRSRFDATISRASTKCRKRSPTCHTPMISHRLAILRLVGPSPSRYHSARFAGLPSLPRALQICLLRGSLLRRYPLR
jgi:hypothetical protein